MMVKRTTMAAVAGSLVLATGVVAAFLLPRDAGQTVLTAPSTARTPCSQTPRNPPPRSLSASVPPAQPELDAIAEVVGQEARARFADTWENVALDDSHDRLLVYVTSFARGRQLIAAVAKDSPGLQTCKIVLKKAGYSRRQLDATMAAVFTPRNERIYGLATLAATVDGSGLDATSASPAAEPRTPGSQVWLASAGRALSAVAAMPVTVTYGTAAVAAGAGASGRG